MHDDGEAAGERHLGLAHATTTGNVQGPVFQPVVGFAPGHHDIGRFVEEPTDHAVSAFCDAADLLRFAGSINPRRQSEDGANQSGFVEAVSDIDAGATSQCGDRANARNRMNDNRSRIMNSVCSSERL